MVVAIFQKTMNTHGAQFCHLPPGSTLLTKKNWILYVGPLVHGDKLKQYSKRKSILVVVVMMMMTIGPLVVVVVVVVNHTRLTPVVLQFFQLWYSTNRPSRPTFITRAVAAAATAARSIASCYLNFHPPVVLYVPAQSNVSLVSLRVHRDPPIYLPSPFLWVTVIGKLKREKRFNPSQLHLYSVSVGFLLCIVHSIIRHCKCIFMIEYLLPF
jgi:hypothetical protein